MIESEQKIADPRHISSTTFELKKIPIPERGTKPDIDKVENCLSKETVKALKKLDNNSWWKSAWQREKSQKPASETAQELTEQLMRLMWLARTLEGRHDSKVLQDQVRVLLAQKECYIAEDSNLENSIGKTALEYALCIGDAAVFQMLLERARTHLLLPIPFEQYKQILLSQAIVYGELEIARTLLNEGMTAGFAQTTKSPETYLSLAAKTGNRVMVDLILDYSPPDFYAPKNVNDLPTLSINVTHLCNRWLNPKELGAHPLSSDIEKYIAKQQLLNKEALVLARYSTQTRSSHEMGDWVSDIQTFSKTTCWLRAFLIIQTGYKENGTPEFSIFDLSGSPDISVKYLDAPYEADDNWDKFNQLLASWKESDTERNESIGEVLDFRNYHPNTYKARLHSTYKTNHRHQNGHLKLAIENALQFTQNDDLVIHLLDYAHFRIDRPSGLVAKATKLKKYSLIQRLIARGESIEEETSVEYQIGVYYSNRMLPLEIAAYTGQCEIINLLMDKSARIRDALNVALKAGQWNAMQTILQHPNMEDLNTHCPRLRKPFRHYQDRLQSMLHSSLHHPQPSAPPLDPPAQLVALPAENPEYKEDSPPPYYSLSNAPDSYRAINDRLLSAPHPFPPQPQPSAPFLDPDPPAQPMVSPVQNPEREENLPPPPYSPPEGEVLSIRI